MTNAAILGYASLDHPMRVGPFRGVAGTTLVRERLGTAWPAPGGVAHLARALSGLGVTAQPVTWIGSDEGGREYRSALAADGVSVDGVRATGRRTPCSYLFYPETGGTVCVYDPGDCFDEPLTEPQRALIRTADWLCVAVGPADRTEEALDLLPERTRVAWAVKADPEAFPPSLARRIATRASVVSWSTGERPFLEECLGGSPLALRSPGRLLVETEGARGVWYWLDALEGHEPTQPVRHVDTTGAGDTLVAGLVAGLSREGLSHTDAVAFAVERVHRQLAGRAAERTGS